MGVEDPRATPASYRLLREVGVFPQVSPRIPHLEKRGAGHRAVARYASIRAGRYPRGGAGADALVGRPYAIRGVSPLLSTERITVTCFQRVIIQAQRISAEYMAGLSHGHQVPNGQNQNGQGRNAAQCHDNGQIDRHQNLR